MPDTPGSPADPSALDALRQRGADPVRLRLVEAFARRASAHAGVARRVLDDKLAALMARLAPSNDEGEGVARAVGARGPLAELVDHVARQKPAPVLGVATKPRESIADKPVAPADARTLQFFKRTWSRLSADQRLAQSRATLPDNAGPLNSHHLVHRSLTLMRELSPEYLEHFVGYIDALQWVEQANEAAAAEPRSTAPRRFAALRRG